MKLLRSRGNGELWNKASSKSYCNQLDIDPSDCCSPLELSNSGKARSFPLIDTLGALLTLIRIDAKAYLR